MILEKRKISELIPANYNPRTISDEAMDGLKTSLQTFGCVEPIVWNKRSGRIVGGHQRLKALASIGEKEVDISVVDLDDKMEKALNATLNNEAIQGKWDIPKLESLLLEIQDIPKFDSLKLSELQDICLEDPINSEDDEEKPEKKEHQKDSKQITCPYCKKQFDLDVELRSKRRRK